MKPCSRAFRFVFSLSFPVLACFAMRGMYAQTASPNAPEPASITLDVLSSDKLGQFVPGLQQSDFTVSDNGQQRQLLDFHAIDAATTPAAVSVLLVTDEVNAPDDVIARERQQIGLFLNQDGGKLSHPTTLAAMTEAGVKMLPGYSQDGHLLQDSFQKIKPELRSAGLTGDAARQMRISLLELHQIAAFEANQPGHKLVLIISPGWPTNFNGPSVDNSQTRPGGRGPKNSLDTVTPGVDLNDKQRSGVFNAIVALSDALLQAHVVLYSLEPYDLGRTEPFHYQGYLKGIKKPDQADFPDAALQVFAEHSGGRALTAEKDILAEINAAVRDGRSYYELTFAASAAVNPNEYHELLVRTDKPGVTARTNAFYYARPQQIGDKPTR
jgi:VWFA-related protein